MPQNAQKKHMRPLRTLRDKLQLFLSLSTVLTLAATVAAAILLLQPMYNRHLKNKLKTRMTTVLTEMNTAIENGEEISRRDFGLVLNEDFWDGMNGLLQNGKLELSGCCLEISDSTCRAVAAVEDLHPCFLHNTQSFGFGSGQESIHENEATAVRLRIACFDSGSLYTVLEQDGKQQMVLGGVTADGSYCVLISTDMTQVQDGAAVLFSMMPGIAIVMLLINCLAAVLFARWYTAPIQALSEAARAIADGDYSRRVPVQRQDELGELSSEFNSMAAEVETASQLQKTMIAGITHDLRTPLTLIKGYAETIRDITGGDAEKRSEQLNIIVDETDRLSSLVNSVLELNKVSSGADKCVPVTFELAQLCEEVADRYTAVCEQKGCTLQVELPPDDLLMVTADPEKLERVLHNLLGNALQHLGSDGVFILRALRCEDGIRVEVEDHGPGIPADELPHLFERYYRSRADAGRQGTGLGLAIVKAILEQHGARYGVRSEVGRGTTFWFTLPGAQKE